MTAQALKLEDLSPGMQDVVAAKTVKAHGRLSDWLELLEGLAAFDNVIDKKRKSAGNRALWLSALTAIILFVATCIWTIAERLNVLTFILLALPVAGLVASIVVCICKYVKYRKLDLDNSFRNLLLPVLKALQDDIEPKGKVNLELDVGKAASPKNRRSKKEVPSKWRKLIETAYFHPWCELTAPLVNGGMLLLKIANNVASYERHYTSRSGKWKVKTKWKVQTIVTAAIAPDAESFSWDRGQMQSLAAEEKVKLKDKGAAQVVHLCRKFKSKVMKPELNPAAPDQVVGMFMQLSSMLAAPTTGGE